MITILCETHHLNTDWTMLGIAAVFLVLHFTLKRPDQRIAEETVYRDLRAEGWEPEGCYPETDAGSNSAGSTGCIADQLEGEGLKRSKAKRCWLCGNKLRGGQNYPRTIDGHERDLHKFCAEEHDKAETRSDNAFGMEY